MLFALEENCSLKFVRDGTLKLLLLLSRGEVVLEFELNTGTHCVELKLIKFQSMFI